MHSQVPYERFVYKGSKNIYKNTLILKPGIKSEVQTGKVSNVCGRQHSHAQRNQFSTHFFDPHT